MAKILFALIALGFVAGIGLIMWQAASGVFKAASQSRRKKQRQTGPTVTLTPMHDGWVLKKTSWRQGLRRYREIVARVGHAGTATILSPTRGTPSLAEMLVMLAHDGWRRRVGDWSTGSHGSATTAFDRELDKLLPHINRVSVALTPMMVPSGNSITLGAMVQMFRLRVQAIDADGGRQPIVFEAVVGATGWLEGQFTIGSTEVDRNNPTGASYTNVQRRVITRLLELAGEHADALVNSVVAHEKTIAEARKTAEATSSAADVGAIVATLDELDPLAAAVRRIDESTGTTTSPAPVHAERTGALADVASVGAEKIDQAVYDRLIAEGKSERIARAKAKAAYVRAQKKRQLAEQDRQSGGTTATG